MGAEPGDEKLHPHCQHLPLLGAFPDRLLQGLQRQAVPARGRGAHNIRPGAGLHEGESSRHIGALAFSVSARTKQFCVFIYFFVCLFYRSSCVKEQ